MMYKLKAEIIFKSAEKSTKENKRIFYECDPSRNDKCAKSGCYINGGSCKHTSNIDFAKRFGVCE